jgi:hypothetical protein
VEIWYLMSFNIEIRHQDVSILADAHALTRLWQVDELEDEGVDEFHAKNEQTRGLGNEDSLEDEMIEDPLTTPTIPAPT